MSGCEAPHAGQVAGAPGSTDAADAQTKQTWALTQGDMWFGHPQEAMAFVCYMIISYNQNTSKWINMVC